MHLAFTAQTTAYHTLTEKQAFFSSLLVQLVPLLPDWDDAMIVDSIAELPI
jgi:hypothetical protein